MSVRLQATSLKRFDWVFFNQFTVVPNDNNWSNRAIVFGVLSPVRKSNGVFLNAFFGTHGPSGYYFKRRIKHHRFWKWHWFPLAKPSKSVFRNMPVLIAFFGTLVNEFYSEGVQRKNWFSKKLKTGRCTSVDNLIDQVKPLVTKKIHLGERDLSVLTTLLWTSTSSKTQTQGGGAKTFIKQSLPATIVCSFDWWFQYRRFGETHDWEPNFISLYSICGSFRLSSSSRKDTEKLNSGELSSKKKKSLLNFQLNCIKPVGFMEIDTKYWDKLFSKIIGCLSFTEFFACSEIVEIFAREMQQVKNCRKRTRWCKSSLYQQTK